MDLLLSFQNDVLAGVAQLVGHRPTNQKVVGLIPSKDTCLGCRFGLRSGHV